MMRAYPPGLTPGLVDFEGARAEILTGFRHIDVALGNSVERTLDIAGDFLYCDTDPANSSGWVRASLNAEQAGATELFVTRGFAIAQPFTKVRLTWDIQEGRSVRLIYGTGVRVFPAIPPVLYTRPDPISAGTGVAYLRQAMDPAAGPTILTLISPGANLIGYTVYEANFQMKQATASPNLFALLTKGSLPASYTDGGPLLVADSWTELGANTLMCGARRTPVWIEPGFGLYSYQSGAALGPSYFSYWFQQGPPQWPL